MIFFTKFIDCGHGYDISSQCPECEAQDDWIESEGGLDQCLNCGKYKTGNQLNRDQVCSKGCVNPNEY